ncbi:HprK-related kinase A [Endozoicomonas sp. SM1973]|uniref:HprK-related kinase A n=1 Tax=Spartinivicinus marinus TaxID=2994442 RepID=A0A853IMA7_9GAMM|nr:HprK-related kinase A [Spartinivicinus marinus]MCX4025343.1 HprK-related kinase A [Spartinivicinus marinus]NYZ68916.1 HprK-related kinase A [Spartinivicinus marinus]
MKIADLTVMELQERLRSGLVYQIGPFKFQLTVKNCKTLVSQLHWLFAHYPTFSQPHLIDFAIQVKRPQLWRRWWRPQVEFKADGNPGMAPFPLDHALPMLEWGSNWCIATHAHRYLMLHAAVVERNGHAILFPAWPGSGKSTLCAALSLSGWRMLSDEFGLLEPESGLLQPLPKLIPLKNTSIEVMKRFSPEAVIGPLFEKTRKGMVAHFRPPAASIEQAQEKARPRWIIFPRYKAGANNVLVPVEKSQALLRLANNAFNYKLLATTGFQAARQLVDQCHCYELNFDSLRAIIPLLLSLYEQEFISPPVNNKNRVVNETAD